MKVETQIKLNKFRCSLVNLSFLDKLCFLKTRRDMINSQFGKWTVVAEVRKENQHCRHYECECSCGIKKIIPGTTLRLGKSLQCYNCAFRKHGMSKTNIYKIWTGIISRCYNPNVRIFKYYGGRGIKVSSAWRTFENFYKDMGERPVGLQLDRIDNNGPYSKENCRWVTPKENNPSNKGTLADNMPGKQFGKWTVRRRVIHKPGHRYYLCSCECGLQKIIRGAELRRGRTTQCRSCKNKSHGLIHRGWNERKKQSPL